MQKLRLRTFCETLGDVQTKALFKTMHQNLAEVKAKTPGDTLLDAKDEAFSDALAASLGEVKAKKLARHE